MGGGHCPDIFVTGCRHDSGCHFNIDSCLDFQSGPPKFKTEVEEDYLPVMRRQLEARLAEIELMATRARADIEEQLADLDNAEQKLRERKEEDGSARDKGKGKGGGGKD